MSCDKTLNQVLKAVHGVAPVADAFSGTVTSAAIKLGPNATRAAAIVYKGVGATGVSTITVDASSDSNGTGATAIPFRYAVNTTSDTYGALTEAATTGFATTAGSNHIYLLDIDPRDLPDGKPWIRVKAVESTDSPVLGGIMWLPFGFNFSGDALGTVLA